VPLVDSWHIGAICAHLEAVTAGQIPKLLVNIPPGCSKSLLACVFWPVWEWTRDPRVRWFFASYDQRLSTRDSVRCRTLIESRWFQARWGHQFVFQDDQNQKTYYETDRGGYRLATSTGGHGTGEHPDRIVVDDPHNVEGAESAAERRAALDWWDQTMSTRGVSRDARRVIIMQRLHQEDLAGHVLGQGGWVHLCLPMRFEKGRMAATPLGWNDPRVAEGELLTPGQFPDAKVREMEQTLGSYGTAGQLQQRPAPREGGLFKSHWFARVDAAPAQARRVRYWDQAATAGGGDYTAGVLMGASEGLFYVEDVVRGQWSAGERDKVILATAEADAERDHRTEQWFEQEPGSGGKESAQAKVRLLAGYRVRTEPVTGSKEVRADPLVAQAEAGNVRLVRGPWNGAYLDELCLFPNGAHDDQVDGSSGAFNKLAVRKKVAALY
jgi:predicted phage terminase large subunit-like protein